MHYQGKQWYRRSAKRDSATFVCVYTKTLYADKSGHYAMWPITMALLNIGRPDTRLNQARRRHGYGHRRGRQPPAAWALPRPEVRDRDRSGPVEAQAPAHLVLVHDR